MRPLRRYCLYWGACALVLVLAASLAQADTVYISDGSRINGRVEGMSADTLSLQTDFAGTLAIAREQVVGIGTDTAVPITLDSGARLRARLFYDPQAASQRYVVEDNDVAGQQEIAGLGAIATIASGTAVAGRAQPSAADAELPAAEIAEYGVSWSGSFLLAANGNSGNTETRSILAEISALRDTGNTRLLLAAGVDKQQEDGEETADQITGTARYERDITERAFWFAQQTLKQDQFEDLDLRSRTLVGPGYFLARRDRLTFKVRGGLGYQYESFTDGSSDGALIFAAGWDYNHLISEWLELAHEFTIFPELTNSPSENFILESFLGAKLPIADSSNWSTRFGLQHEYNNNPEPGVEKLDTTYNIGVVRDF